MGSHGNPGWETLLQAKDARVPLGNQDAFKQIIYSCSMMTDMTVQYYDSTVQNHRP